MDLKATIDTDTFGYRNRLVLIALGALAYAALCVYDGSVKYPKQMDMYEQFMQVKTDHPKDWRAEWEKTATANGWDGTKEPKERSQGDILTQWAQFAIVFPIGAYCLFNVIKWSRRYIGADEGVLYASGDIEVPFDQIARIDASRWENKGIARVYYDLGQGENNILIDDFKFERTTTDAIFDRLKDNVDNEKIEGLTEPVEEEPEDQPEAETNEPEDEKAERAETHVG